jgi:hypothetical protein
MALYFNGGMYKVAHGGTIYNAYYDPSATPNRILRDVWKFNDIIDLDYSTIESFAIPVTISEFSLTGFMVDYNYTMRGLDGAIFNKLLFIINSDTQNTISSMMYAYVTEYDEDTGNITLRDSLTDSFIYTHENGWCIGDVSISTTYYESLARVRTFGSAGMEVSKEFYNWYTNTATQMTENLVSGQWKFNETLTLDFDGRFETDYDSMHTFDGVVASFTNVLRDGLFYAIALTVEVSKPTIILNMSMSYRHENDSNSITVCVTNSNSTTWHTASLGADFDALRTIDFGDDVQYLDEWFYNWFIANATKVGEVPEPQEYTLGGCYQWNENISTTLTNFTENVSFRTSLIPLMQCSAFFAHIDNDGDVSFKLAYNINSEIKYSDYLLYSVWIDTDRLIDFGDTEQTVSKEFYELVTKNAVSADWDETIALTHTRVYGRWIWNDAVEVSDGTIIFTGDNHIKINNTEYIAAFIEHNKQNVEITVSNGTDYTAINIYDGAKGGWGYTDDDGVFTESRLYQIWDFGDEGVLIDNVAYAYLCDNATEVTDEPSIEVESEENTYGGLTYTITASDDAISTEINDAGGLTYTITA